MMIEKATVISTEEAVDQLMAILEGAKMKGPKADKRVKVAAKVEVAKEVVQAEPVPVKSGFVDGVYVREVHQEDESEAVAEGVLIEGGSVIAVNGKSVFTGNKKKGTGGGSAKNDPGREMIKALFMSELVGHAVLGANTFSHSTEGFVIRLDEADYAIKVSKSKENKFDMSESDFAVEKDFATRGKVKNSSSIIAKVLFARFENEISKPELEFNFAIVSAKASGIVLQGALGEYTVKISKKRDRVGFEAEKGVSYEK